MRVYLGPTKVKVVVEPVGPAADGWLVHPIRNQEFVSVGIRDYGSNELRAWQLDYLGVHCHRTTASLDLVARRCWVGVREYDARHRPWISALFPGGLDVHRQNCRGAWESKYGAARLLVELEFVEAEDIPIESPGLLNIPNMDRYCVQSRYDLYH